MKDHHYRVDICLTDGTPIVYTYCSNGVELDQLFRRESSDNLERFKITVVKKGTPDWVSGFHCADHSEHVKEYYESLPKFQPRFYGSKEAEP